MAQLPWLDDAQRHAVEGRIRVIGEELPKRHWGLVTRDPDLAGSRPATIYILDFRGLMLAAGALRHVLRESGTRLLYRGQTQEHATGLLPGLFRGVTSKSERKLRYGVFTKAMATLATTWDHTGSTDEREALAQHYGLRTPWLDVLDHIQTAAWFAYDLVGPPRRIDETPSLADARMPGRADDSVGYIFLLAVPLEKNEHCKYVDLRLKGSNWLRPHVQQAFSVSLQDPVRYATRLDRLHVATFVVPRPMLRAWSSYDNLGPEVMYSNAKEDEGLSFWARAAARLRPVLGRDYETLVWCEA